jgi:ribosomal protein S18 acetylase RimI-like enzyme
MSFMLGLGSNCGGEVGVVSHADTCAGAIVSFAPRRYPVPGIGAGIEGLQALRFLPRGWVPWRSGLVGLRLLSFFEKLHPRESHWYILVIGVDPEFQGTGKGAELFAPVLRRADQEKQLVYLESSNPKNHSFYGKTRISGGE